MNDTELRALHQKVIDRRPRGDCPDPERLARLADGSLPTADRELVLDHVLGCAACEGDLKMLRTLARAERQPAALPTRWLALAASLLVMVGGAGVWTAIRGRLDESGRLRGGANRIATVGPLGRTQWPVTFTWRAHTGATAYRISVVDSGGELVWSTSTRDTTAVPGDTAWKSTAPDYRWWVEATLSDGKSIRSQVEPLHLTRP